MRNGRTRCPLLDRLNVHNGQPLQRASSRGPDGWMVGLPVAQFRMIFYSGRAVITASILDNEPRRVVASSAYLLRMWSSLAAAAAVALDNATVDIETTVSQCKHKTERQCVNAQVT